MKKRTLARILKISLLSSAIVLLSGCVPHRSYRVYSPPRIYNVPTDTILLQEDIMPQEDTMFPPLVDIIEDINLFNN